MTTTNTTHLILSQEQREDLSILFRLPTKDLVSDFAHSSIHFLSNPPKNPTATFQNVAAHLPNQLLSRQQVEHAMKALSNAYATATRKGLTEEAFASSLLEAFGGDETSSLPVEGLNTLSDFCALLTHHYTQNKLQLTTIFQNQTQYGNHYQELRWRFETQLASRHSKAELEPHFYLHMKTTQYQTPMPFQIKNFDEMKRITTKMENALKDLKTNHARRMKKYIQ